MISAHVGGVFSACTRTCLHVLVGLLALLDGLPPRQRAVLTTSELLESSGTTATPGPSFGTTRSTMSVQAAGQVETLGQRP